MLIMKHLIFPNYVELQHLFPGSVRLPAIIKVIGRSDIGNIVIIKKLLPRYIQYIVTNEIRP